MTLHAHTRPATAPPPLVPAVCIMLAGGPRPTALVRETGCSVLDLTITPTSTVLELWIKRLTELCGAERLPPIRIVHDARSAKPTADHSTGPLRVEVLQERLKYRGPVGIARDETDTLDPDDVILIIEAARIPCASITGLLHAHHQTRADVTVVANPDSTAAGLFLFRRRLLDVVPERGFMDLKEQWLSKGLSLGWSVRMHTLAAPGTVHARTRERFLRAVDALHHLLHPDDTTAGGAEAVWAGSKSGPSVCAASAAVAPDAAIVHSVVMSNARVGAGAIVARSIVAPGATVEDGQVIVDSVVSQDGIHFSGKSR